jgi:hypothetical protein
MFTVPVHNSYLCTYNFLIFFNNVAPALFEFKKLQEKAIQIEAPSCLANTSSAHAQQLTHYHTNTTSIIISPSNHAITTRVAGGRSSRIVSRFSTDKS